MSNASFLASDANHPVVMRALHWALPRLAAYALAAIASMVVFTGGATLYVHVWPGKSLLPIQSTPSKEAPEKPSSPNVVPVESTPGSDLKVLVQSSPNIGVAVPLFGQANGQLVGKKLLKQNTVLGEIVQVNRDASGAIVSLSFVEEIKSPKTVYVMKVLPAADQKRPN